MAGDSVANAVTLSGTNSRPMPRPWMMPETTNGCASMVSEKWLIISSAVLQSPSPAIRISRVSTRPTSRPTMNIARNEPMPRGIITRPAPNTE
jgi:hypothetical protein